jgi:hypothetical protein
MAYGQELLLVQEIQEALFLPEIDMKSYWVS